MGGVKQEVFECEFAQAARTSDNTARRGHLRRPNRTTYGTAGRNGRYRQPANDVTLKFPVFSDISGVGKWDIYPPWLVAVYSRENAGKDRSCHQRGQLVVSSRDYTGRNRDQREYDNDVVRNPRAETPFHFARSLRPKLFGRMESARLAAFRWNNGRTTTGGQPHQPIQEWICDNSR